MTNLTKPCKNLFCGFVLAVAVLGSFAARADDKMKMNFKDEDISKVLENYAKASGQKFVIDPSVHGKITILNNEPVAIDEAFNQLSIALALNQFCLIKEGDTFVVTPARNAMHSQMEVGTQLPPMKPEKMFTMIFNLKYVSAEEMNRSLRILPSRDGELAPFRERNQLIVTDWVSNLYRINDIIKQLDQPANPAVAKIISESKAEAKERAAMLAREHKGEPPPRFSEKQ